ncbi:carboxy-S-adenosyl-L-methionine synthase CmoA [Chitinivibrio alkaliphilus]|uniref:Carboxy-S-adenosyl-L-methionine synthase n=1 Tax=Chitinivibrio alkaliphilus ACht1 TaxID=1313304 RepID=U7DAG9_9BACT|nr:carboxy-S-adenosyl-L-methionine synthase CmoA [Chitinivibrio alkaliphilus]ERP39394.1 methyltransferase [Chitinivibrio alkaliphilus ACht1]
MKRDILFRSPQNEIAEFTFNAEVTEVFDDMLTRSVPGYGTLISLIALWAKEYVQEGSNVYDLGASLGTATQAIAHNARETSCTIYAVDTSTAMVEALTKNVAGAYGLAQVVPRCEDICTISLEQASLTVLNLTLQFIPPEQRLPLLQRIYAHTLPGGVVFLAEKCDDTEEMTELYYAFKRANGYNNLEISQKRTALEQVLIPDTDTCHRDRLHRAGFSRVECIFQALQFRGYAAWK